MLLPEPVGLDDVGGVDLAGEVVEHLENGLHRGPRRAAHVDDDGEGQLADVVAGKKREN